MKAKWFLLGLAVLIPVMVVSCFVMAGRTDEPTAPRSTGVSVGDTVRLASAAEHVLLGKTKADYSELTKFALANDTQGMLGLVLAGRAKLVKSGTEARVLSRSFALTEVRVQDGTVTGWSGWIAMEHVRR